ncbi:hypothetical protein [Adlercreutzia muris]|uniref:hypothetical protein n=1 Tax=Adlercreutzia muris TaxID=1796610 RepID=UPI001365E2C5|nr:hypothetical protein [Adlercreutzia muris]NCA32186.1 hypothetical protein [Adlercreutzia muris]
MVDSWPPINGLTEVLLQVSDRFSKLFDEAFQSASPLEKNEIVSPDLRDGASSREKDMAFKEAIESLARLDVSLDHADMEKFADFFTRLYTENDQYRHKYSIIYAAVMGNFSTSRNGSLDCGVPPRARQLSENILNIEQFMSSNEAYSESFAIKSVRKLQDHIELEHQRMSYVTLQNSIHSEEVEGIKESAAELVREAEQSLVGRIQSSEKQFNDSVERSKAEYTQQTMMEIEKSNKSLQKNYVTILGIFAAIVIAFMSDAVFANSILDNISNASIHRLSFVMLCLGFFIFNTLVALFYFVLRVSCIGLGNPAKRFVYIADGLMVLCIALVVLDRAFHFIPLG